MEKDLDLKKWVPGLAVATIAATIGQVAFISSSNNSRHAGEREQASLNPIERFDPYAEAKIIREIEGTKGQDDSLILRQTLSDGTTVTIRKPVFVGETAIREPGEEVIPANLERPLHEQP